ncbi:MAG TPA: hypothetical protein VJC10_02110 [Patescibacteria group bacterium]|nr:hypothetical protein [Patescibacteria group bacterium]
MQDEQAKQALDDQKPQDTKTEQESKEDGKNDYCQYCATICSHLHEA